MEQWDFHNQVRDSLNRIEQRQWEAEKRARGYSEPSSWKKSTVVIIFLVIFVLSIISTFIRLLAAGTIVASESLFGASESLFGVVLAGVFIFLSQIGVDISSTSGILIAFLVTAVIFLLFLLSIVLLIVVIVKKKREKKKAKQIARQSMNNGQDVHISPEEMAKYNQFFEEEKIKISQEILERSQEEFREKNG